MSTDGPGALPVGARLGPYAITARLGAGGMGEVYRARDTRLERDVAVKVLPPAWAADPDRVARFEREAKAASGLSHPNVAAVYDFGEADGCAYLVMEYVAGQTLATHSGGRALPIATVVELARQMAEALDEAHTHGVVHRDIKPANVMVTPRGLVKVLDFGLARLDRPEGASSETPTRLTRVGAVLGTVQYMSPEQVLGREVDGRSDLFSVGLVIYEMATGRPAFSADSPSQVADRILHEQPPALAAFSHDVPPELERIVRKCLEKDRECRYQSARELAVDLGNLKRDLGAGIGITPSTPGAASSAPGVPPSAAPALRSRRQPLTIGLACVTVALAGALLWSLMRTPAPSSPTPARVSRLSIMLPPGRQLISAPLAIAISPDGREVVCVVEEDRGRPGPMDDVFMLYRRSLADGTATPIAGTEFGGVPGFSPDGDWIGFFDNTSQRLKRMPIAGGTPLAVSAGGIGHFTGFSWMGSDAIVYATAAALYRVPAEGGPGEVLTSRTQMELQKGEFYIEAPSMLPGTSHLMFSLEAFDVAQSSIFVRANNTLKRLPIRGMYPLYLPAGYILFFKPVQAQQNAFDLYAVPFDVSRLEVTGKAVLVLANIRYAQLAVSRDGTLVYNGSHGGGYAQQLVSVDRQGAVEPVGEKWIDASRLYGPRVSPDGTQVLMWGGGAQPTEARVYVFDLLNRRTKILTSVASGWACWTADGKRVVFNHQAADGGSNWNLYWKSADGTGPEERLTTSPYLQQPLFVTRDGVLVYQEEAPGTTGYDLWMLPLQGNRVPKPLRNTKANENLASLSSNGQYMAYVSDESGMEEVWVCRLPQCDAATQISTSGGTGPVWSSDGRELFYRSAMGNSLSAVPVTWSPAPSFGAPVVTGGWWLEEFPYGRNYDAMPDGKHLVMLAQTMTAGNEITVVLNWIDELKRKMGGGGAR